MMKRKRIFASLLILMMLTAIICPSVSAAVVPEQIRVGLFYGSTGKTSITVSGKGGMRILADSWDNEIAKVEDAVTLSLEDGVFVLSGIGEIEAETVIFSPAGDRITVNKKEYRGSLECKNAGSNMTVINLLGFEEYLYSVVGKEMAPSWPLEALKAQAVSARNYAISNYKKHEKLGFNICATADCQTYGGVEGESEKTIRAVEETRGVVAYYNGAVAELLYTTSDGGSTESSFNVWTATVPYLMGKEDPYENTKEATHGVWTMTFTPEELSKKITGIGTITDIVIKERTDMGSVYEVEVIGTEGSKTFTKNSARTAFGVYSQKYTVTKNGDGEVGFSLMAVDGTSISGGEKVLSAKGISTLPTEGIAVQSAKGVSTPSLSTGGEATSFTFDGEGFGHRVGMSQYGAKAMAELGFTYREILQFYYEGVTF